MLTLERLKELMEYNPETGIFTRIKTVSRWFKGETVGSRYNNGYIIISIDGKKHVAHVLAWFYMTGRWPDFEIDHWDLNRSNNKWFNLREATRSQNQHNTPAYRNNKLGVKGVCESGGRFKAQIATPNGVKYLGTYSNVEEASKAYQKAANEIFGQFVHGTFKSCNNS